MMKTERESLNGQGFTVIREAADGQGEDGVFAATHAGGGFLCVADGCGGSGARRYAKLDGRTEACCASRIAVECAEAWAREGGNAAPPSTAGEARVRADRLAAALRDRLTAFHARYRNDPAGGKILANGFIRTLPTTLCLAQLDARDARRLSCVFYWAGDSRGYLLCADGLRQCTADHTAGRPDAMENLYRDARLSNVVNADGPFRIDTFGLTVSKPCVALTVTDGAYAYLPTPMEFELLLLKTLEASPSLHGWRTRLSHAFAKTAGDDASLALACFGAESFEALKACLAPRRAAFQARYVTPVRRRGQNVAFARALWAEYRQGYEMLGEDYHADWRL